MENKLLMGGGLIHGGDGKIQGRKLAAWLCFLLGLALLVIGSLEPPQADLSARIAPALVALVFSLLFWGLLTVQNVCQLLALVKGQDQAWKTRPGLPSDKE